LKNIIIFIRTHNDLDNILPFIDYVLVNQKAKIVLYKVKERILIGCEDHLRYLKERHGLIPITYDQDISKRYSMFIKAYQALHGFASNARKNVYYTPILMLLSWLYPVTMYLTQKEIERIQRSIDADTIMMDYGSENLLYGGAIVKYARDRLIKTVGYLHGFCTYTNVDTLQKNKVALSPIKKFILRCAKPMKKRLYFDRYIVGNEQKYTLFSKTFDKKYLDRVHEIGVPRYTSEWINKYKKDVIHLKKFNYGEADKINVVLFMTHPKYNISIDDLVSTMKALSLCDNINFVFKPHTRNGLGEIDPVRIKGHNASKISSLELSLWADVGIVTGSSIAFQLLQDNVPLIMPKYLHSNTTIFEENGACIVVNSTNELISIFTKSKNEITNLVNQENVSNLIKHYVYGGGDYDSLMNNFYHSSVDV
jgi:hypothetical protein